jgi:zinc/manganese transport system substrate-binding protein
MRTILIVPLAVAALTACGSAASGARDVVASTNVYGAIAQQIAGRHAHVTSILTSPTADPHLFEAGNATGLLVARAAVVIQNGLGYDAFMTRLESAAPNSKRVVVTVADALGVHGADANPHLWYDVSRLPRIAAAIAAAFERVDPAHVRAYRRGLRGFDASLRPLDRAVAALRGRSAGAPVAYTEPVPGYLLAAAGLRNLAPGAFTRAVEDGSEPPPSAVATMQSLLTQHRIRALLYNDQAISPVTQHLSALARANGIPVIGVSETLPPGKTFVRWQLGQVDELAAALR